MSCGCGRGCAKDCRGAPSTLREAHAIKGRTFVTEFDARIIAQTERALLSTVSVEDYVHDALHLVELDRVQGVGHLDMGVAFPLDRDD